MSFVRDPKLTVTTSGMRSWSIVVPPIAAQISAKRVAASQWPLHVASSLAPLQGRFERAGSKVVGWNAGAPSNLIECMFMASSP
jgi:hypothetical protein